MPWLSSFLMVGVFFPGASSADQPPALEKAAALAFTDADRVLIAEAYHLWRT
jgi:hypothetical protein